MKQYKNIEGLIFIADEQSTLYVNDSVVRPDQEDWDDSYREDQMTHYGVLDDDGVDLVNPDVEEINLSSALELNFLEEV